MLFRSDVVTGSRVRAKVVKNKVAPPFTQAEFDIMYDSGISYEGDLVDLGSDSSVINKTGAWYSYGDVRLGQGRENAKLFLKDNPDVAEEIAQKIKSAKGLKLSSSGDETEAVEEAAE